MTFSLCTWNILADSYIRPSYYTHIPPAFLDSKRRIPLLIERAVALDRDILCLQEVEGGVYRQLQHALTPLGFRSLFALKGAGKPDGCATFYRTTHCSLLRDATLYYDDGQPKSGHISQLMTFVIDGVTVAIANTHLKWDAPGETWTFRQAQMAVGALLAIAADAHVICGDFNAGPESSAVQCVRAKGFEFTHRDVVCFTSNFNRQPELIDFILYKGLEGTPQPLPCVTAETPLPSAEEPSDHLPVSAFFAAGQAANL